MTDECCVEHHADEPITLHRIMQEMIGEGLREHYKPPQKLSHELFVLLMQLKEQERREAAAASCRPARSRFVRRL
jgi:hypothetical protein